jgi:hypothetical protein
VWTCLAAFQTDTVCDCGCGVFDTACASTSSSACSYCNDTGSCATTCSGINPTNNAVCN